MASNWAVARNDIKTAILANAAVPSARINLADFNQDPADWTDPAKDFDTPFNSAWILPRVDSVPANGPLWIGSESPHFRRGLLTIEHYFIPGTAESDFAAVFDPLVSVLNRSHQGIVKFDDFDEPDVIGLTDDEAWFRVDIQAAFTVFQTQ